MRTLTLSGPLRQGQELDAVLDAWWDRAILDTDPGRDRIHAAAAAGTLPTMTIVPETMVMVMLVVIGEDASTAQL